MVSAVVLAAGQGKRMGTKTPKQFLEMNGQPIIAVTLGVFENSPEIDEIILVTSADYVPYCRKEIVEKYGFTKVKDVVPGGTERYDSVQAGLHRVTERARERAAGNYEERTSGVERCYTIWDYVLIHDGARPFVTEEILKKTVADVKRHGASAVGVPSTDTIKIADEEGFIRETPLRSLVWNIQTPQAFELKLITRAYEIAKENGMTGITDDAMVMERSGLAKVHLVEGSYGNIKITTPEDLRKI